VNQQKKEVDYDILFQVFSFCYSSFAAEILETKLCKCVVVVGEDGIHYSSYPVVTRASVFVVK